MLTINPYASLAFAADKKQAVSPVVIDIPYTAGSDINGKLAVLQQAVTQAKASRGKNKLSLRMVPTETGVRATIYQGQAASKAKQRSKGFYFPPANATHDLGDLAGKIYGTKPRARYEGKLQNGAFVFL
jgi:hypothetical protein